jgi:16S rRNA (uracil1498-N3)-methyltransferase
MRRFFIPSEQLHCSDPFLEGAEARHILQVLRKRIGDQVLLFDNSNQEFLARIASLTGNQVHFEILDRQTVLRESPLQVTLALPIIRPQPFEWILQKGTELGAVAFRPFYSAHSRRLFENAGLESRMNRWQRILVESAKQCERNVLPKLFPAVPFAGLLQESPQALRILPYEEEDSRTLNALELPPSFSGAVLALIGPEGGFQKKEVEQAQEKGFVPVSLGPRTLRSETAALALLCLLQFLWGDMGVARRVVNLERATGNKD